MKYLYKFFGGRKLFYFNFIFLLNFIAVIESTWVEAFGYFSVMLYTTIVLGIEGNKVIKGKYENNKK